MAMTRLAPALLHLPEEIIGSILSYLPAQTLELCGAVCRKLNVLANEPLLWRVLCQTHFRSWHPRHQLATRLTRPVEETHWKLLFRERSRINRETAETLNSILETQQCRIDKIEKIVGFGLDATDVVLDNVHCADDAEDVLSRRYYSEQILSASRRKEAVELWSTFRNGADLPLETLLAAYDLFVLGSREGGPQDVSKRLDAIAEQLKSHNQQWEEWHTRRKALAIASYLIDHDMVGLEDDRRYYDLQNSFIGLALHSEGHPSIPLISTTIYCAVASRLGVRAELCGYPNHIYAIVFSPDDCDLDGKKLIQGAEPEKMYLDPWESAEEIDEVFLKRGLTSMGIPESIHDTFLVPSSTTDIVLRCGRNIMNAVQTVHQQAADMFEGRRSLSLRIAAMEPNLETAFYATLWSSIILGVPRGASGAGPPQPAVTTNRMAYLPYFAKQLGGNFPEDVGLIEEHVLPLFHNLPEWRGLLGLVSEIRKADAQTRPVVRRTEENREVRFKIGQVFQHKRYGYEAIVVGWDKRCEQSEDWVETMGVNSLLRGKAQPFYHAV